MGSATLNKPASNADSGSAGFGDANKGNPWRLASAILFSCHSLVQLLLNQLFTWSQMRVLHRDRLNLFARLGLQGSGTMLLGSYVT